MASIFIAALYNDVLSSLNTYLSMGDPSGIPATVFTRNVPYYVCLQKKEATLSTAD